jgi:hypothetical protein
VALLRGCVGVSCLLLRNPFIAASSHRYRVLKDEFPVYELPTPKSPEPTMEDLARRKLQEDKNKRPGTRASTAGSTQRGGTKSSSSQFPPASSRGSARRGQV